MHACVKECLLFGAILFFMQSRVRDEPPTSVSTVNTMQANEPGIFFYCKPGPLSQLCLHSSTLLRPCHKRGSSPVLSWGPCALSNLRLALLLSLSACERRPC